MQKEKQVREHTGKKRYVYFLCVMLLGMVFFGGCRKNSPLYVTADTETAGEEHPGTEIFQSEAADETGIAVNGGNAGGDICVYVCGAVCQPGVYILKTGSRVCDAIAAAGGLKEEASRDFWNQAEYVKDGQMIDVPLESEAESGQMNFGKTEESAEESLSGTDSEGRININTASREELLQIPGIGASRAEEIIRYREKSGGFSRIEDIMNVSGIKEGLFEKMKDYIIAN